MEEAERVSSLCIFDKWAVSERESFPCVFSSLAVVIVCKYAKGQTCVKQGAR